MNTSTTQVESGIQLYSRVNRKNDLKGINSRYFPNGGPLPNESIEVIGDLKLDKTDLLLDFIVKCILPSNLKPEWKSSGAVLVICEHQLNIFKIIKVIEAHLKRNNVLDPKKEILESALKNLTIFNCYCPEDLDLAVMNLQRLILVKDNINLVVVDNISAYYWIAKQKNNISYYHHAQQIFQKVISALASLNVVFLYARIDKMNYCASKKRFQKLDYRIYIEREESQKKYFKTTITDFSKQDITRVHYKFNIVLEFL